MGWSCLVSVLAVTLMAADAPPLRPTDWEKMFIPPGPTVVRFTTLASLTSEVSYTIRDYWGHEVASDKGDLVGESVELKVDLTPGFYEIDMRDLDLRFGLVVSEPAPEPDPFFCIDASLAWLVRDDLRGAFLRILRRSGIDMARDRLSWNAICSSSDHWNWETAARYATLHGRYQKQGMKILQMNSDSPRWMGRVGKYPEDLPGAASAWRQIAARWQSAWGGIEIWNEPDTAYGDLLPGDQYLALVKTLAFAQQQERSHVPLIGGAVAEYHRPFLDGIARNGLLEMIDAFSFHTYARAEQTESLVGQYREWLGAYKHASLPLWITESGRPWKQGPGRPPMAEDAVSALDIVAKAVEARACGVARYFAFVYPFDEENDQNFGMMGRENTPLRSMAAYATAARVLAGKPYLGDAKCSDKTVRRLRVFGDQRESVAVLYTGAASEGAAVAIDLPIRRAAGIDGRELRVTEGRVPVPDGLTYVWLQDRPAADRLQTQTPAMRLAALTQPAPAARGMVSPVVLRLQYETDTLTPSPAGYTVRLSKTAKLPLTVRAFNLSESPLSLRLVASSSRFGTRWLGSQQQSVEVRSHSKADARWSVDLSNVLSEAGSVRILVRAEGSGAGKVAPLSIELLGQPDLKQLLARYRRQVQLNVGQTDRWEPQIGANGAMKLTPQGEGACRLVASFASQQRWAYPRFRLPDDIELSRFDALVFEARCERPASVRVMLWEGDSGVCYQTSQPIIPADGTWHAASVRFRDLTLSTANEPDPNARLDLNQVRQIAIGMNSDQSENALELRQVHLVGE